MLRKSNGNEFHDEGEEGVICIAGRVDLILAKNIGKGKEVNDRKEEMKHSSTIYTTTLDLHKTILKNPQLHGHGPCWESSFQN